MVIDHFKIVTLKFKWGFWSSESVETRAYTATRLWRFLSSDNFGSGMAGIISSSSLSIPLYRCLILSWSRRCSAVPLTRIFYPSPSPLSWFIQSPVPFSVFTEGVNTDQLLFIAVVRYWYQHAYIFLFIFEASTPPAASCVWISCAAISRLVFGSSGSSFSGSWRFWSIKPDGTSPLSAIQRKPQKLSMLK